MGKKRLKIGVFDSGLGGLTVVKALGQVIKNADIFYIADTLHAPYGEKTSKEILQYSLKITQYLIDIYNIDALVIACNTATSAAVQKLRQRYPKLIIVGAEPAIKPAIERTKTGHVGVLATPATLKGDKYQSLSDKLSFHTKVTLHEQACPGLVEHIEKDTLESKDSIELLKQWLTPMYHAGVDTIVLGCTHYPLAASLIEKMMHNGVILLDSAKPIANHLLRLLVANMGHHNEGKTHIYLFYTAQINTFMVDKVLNDYKLLTYVNIS